ncbi:MAG: ATP synthase F1 subunit epsilon [Candidatus Saccharibacteria bacterium]|nr:ATP synthase F1 subunit epsilon [Candidatus Saccharibacteria bacterium]
MKLSLVTLLGTKLDTDVYGVTLPTKAGEISVYQGHEALITLAKPGIIAVRYKKHDSDKQIDYFATSGGVVEIEPDAVKVLVDEADHGDDIIESESKAALERALKLKTNAKNQIELEDAGQLVDRHAVRLKVAGLRRHKRR